MHMIHRVGFGITAAMAYPASNRRGTGAGKRPFGSSAQGLTARGTSMRHTHRTEHPQLHVMPVIFLLISAILDRLGRL